MPTTILTIGELAQLSGLTTHTIRFYEAAGVLKPNRRAANGHRRYQKNDVLWVEFVLKLKLAGMSLTEIKRYADLRARGESTLQQRFTLLQLHRQRLATKMAELAACAKLSDRDHHADGRVCRLSRRIEWVVCGKGSIRRTSGGCIARSENFGNCRPANLICCQWCGCAGHWDREKSRR